jgi:hypothetical protein
VNFERLLADSEMFETWPHLAVPFERLPFSGARVIGDVMGVNASVLIGFLFPSRRSHFFCSF